MLPLVATETPEYVSHIPRGSNFGVVLLYVVVAYALVEWGTGLYRKLRDTE